MEHPYPQVTVDAVLLTLKEDRLHVALFQRPANAKAEPGKLALPGGFVHVAEKPGEPEDESLEAAMERVLREKTGFMPRYLEQLKAFSGRARDARRWSVSEAFIALVPEHELDSAPQGVFRMYDAEHLPALAFDHNEIVAEAVRRVRSKARYSALPCLLLPELFTLTQLRLAYVAMTGEPQDHSSFRTKLKKLQEKNPFIEPTGQYQIAAHKPAELYRLKQFVVFDRTI